jgi:hypothetical protein
MKLSFPLILVGLLTITGGIVLRHPTGIAAKILPPPPPPTVPITVHFPRMPISGYNFEYTYNVARSASAQFKDVPALQQLFAGPTAAEVSAAPGLIRPLPLLSATACNGQTPPPGVINAGRFMLRRTLSGSDVAYKIRFCQSYSSGGIGDDARLQNAIKETLWANLNYLPGVNNITQIEIATSNNFCLGGSGNICWP